MTKHAFKKALWAAVILALLLGVFIGWQTQRYVFAHTFFQRKILREKINDYTFINPIIGFDTAENDNSKQFRDLSMQINSYIEDRVKKGRATAISAYVRDLNTGDWMGINEDEKYAPASLFKVFMMVAYLRLAEEDPGILGRELFYDGVTDLNELAHYTPSTSLDGNRSYPINELIRRMIIQSGNNSHALLANNLGEERLVNLLTDLGLPYPKSEEEIDFMSARSYSFIFRVLYNATYLSRAMSERALELLSETEFDLGLVAGVPSGTTVAHKFGERWFLDDPKKPKELHDCGIVYYPEKPYFICVMTKGTNFVYLENTIKEISRMAYSNVNYYSN